MAGDMNDYSQAKTLMEARGETLSPLTMESKKRRRSRKVYTVPLFEVSRGMHRRLEADAKANERSMDGQVRFILRFWYSKKEDADGNNPQT